MDIRLLYLVLVSVVTAWDLDPELGEHLQRLVRYDDVDGYSMATLHALDTATGQLSAQSKRDIEAHASDSTSDKSDFSLHLTSGERLRMTLKRRSVATSDTTVTELKEDGTRETIQLQARDCYFSGPVEEELESGMASLSMCNGRLMGSVITAKRSYELHVLPVDTDKRSADDTMQVLVTWEDTWPKRATDNYVTDQLDVPEEEMSDEDDSPEELLSLGVDNRKASIEIADIMDKHYVNDLKLKYGYTTTEEITNLAFNKWNAAAYVLSDADHVTWDITLKMVALEIWRTDPDFYNTQSDDTLGRRMGMLCKNTSQMWTYDQVTLHTGRPIQRKGREVGLAWVGGVCMKKFRCSGVRSLRNGLGAELHELGHGLGLKHEKGIPECADLTDDPWRGFMGGNRTHFRRCYRHTLDIKFTKKNKRCLFTDFNDDTLNWDLPADQ